MIIKKKKNYRTATETDANERGSNDKMPLVDRSPAAQQHEEFGEEADGSRVVDKTQQIEALMRNVVVKESCNGQ